MEVRVGRDVGVSVKVGVGSGVKVAVAVGSGVEVEVGSGVGVGASAPTEQASCITSSKTNAEEIRCFRFILYALFYQKNNGCSGIARQPHRPSLKIV
ncbi:MAG: hypothetical protein DDG60_04630 [Anaerolineae bacterium]|nr:MAG: hypothetical protein DDG60_04630 [Anaerolineae bacterium]